MNTELKNKDLTSNDAKPMLSAVLSRDDKKRLLENAKTFEALTLKQMFRLIWWEYTKKHKAEVFYNSLNIGKSAHFAFKDAEHC